MNAFWIPALATTPAAQPGLSRRVLRMATAWAAIGALMGASLGIEGGSAVGVVACMLAGMIEMAALGAVFGLIGGTPEESVLGAVWGLIASLVIGLAVGHAQIALVAAFGLAVGGITGATYRPYLRLLRLPLNLLGRLRPAPRRRPTSPGDGLASHAARGGLAG